MSNDTNEPNHGKIAPLLIQDEMKSCYLDYAMSVIVGRALPDVRDGFKPVHRRILYAMHMLNNYAGRPYMKSARVVGDVIGKYHPHGDTAVYGAMVRLAQDFSMRYTIIDGQGNFGSIDGDNAAAMRYTEVRMQKMANDMMDDIDKETVDWQENYDGSLEEPTVIPTKIPNLLINGSAGIAVGMATNIPPHNLTEISNGLTALIDNPNISIHELMKIIPGPDFPTAGSIHGTSGIHQAFLTGKGVIQIRAKAEVEVGKNDREKIVITEIPYQVNKSKLIERIAELVHAKEIEGISDIRDESSREGIRVVIDVKRGENSSVLLNRLYKQTQMQVSFGIIFLSISNGQPKVMNLKEMLQCFIEHRREVIIRRTNYELKKAKERAHILEGLKIAVENIDAIVELIKKAEGPQQAKEQLMTKFELSTIQAQAVLDMRLQRLTGLERDKIIADYQAVMKEIARLEEILGSEVLIAGIIRTEFETIRELYGDERRTEIVAQADEFQMEDLIANEEVIVTITHKGYLKRMAIDTYRSQKRGGKGVKGADLDDDFYTSIFTAETHDTLMIFTDKGTVFTLKVYQIPEGPRTTKGRNVVNLLSIPTGEKVQQIITLPKESERAGKFLIISTEHGIVKRSELEEYKNVKSSGIKAIKVVEGDSVNAVRITDGKKDVLLCSSGGKSIRFKEEDARAMGRVSQGVKGMTLEEGEKVIGMSILEPGIEILSVTERGYGKRSEESEYRTQTRGGKGILAMKLTDKTGNIVSIKPVNERDDLMIITDKGQVIRTKISGISLLGRNTQGVRLINVKADEKVIAIEKIVDPDDEPVEGGEGENETPELQ
ncbi:MAG: DNA gyrase subunit A [Bacteriovoracaceae bacterium]|nr:DNA gyrase subunit A [Bacteriovoracaceae bacterium]